MDGRLVTGLVYDKLRIRSSVKVWGSCIWKGYIPPKFSFTAWLTCRGRLATRDTLGFLELTDDTCPFCQRVPETRQHLFYACPTTRAVWDGVRSWLGVSRQMSTIDSAIKWIKKDYGGGRPVSKMLRLSFCATIYYIWQARNAAVFERNQANPQAILARVKLSTYRVLYRLYPHVQFPV